MKQKLIPDRISREEEKQLTAEDLELLKKKRDKQFLFLLSGYLPFIAFGLYILFMGPSSLNTGRRTEFTRVNLNEDMQSRFWTVAPYFLGFLFVLLTIYFAKLYFQSLGPLISDIKHNRKKLLFFKPAKNPMAFFNKYYLSTPLYNNQQIEVSKEDFDSIPETGELCLEVGPRSLFILNMKNGDRVINYY